MSQGFRTRRRDPARVVRKAPGNKKKPHALGFPMHKASSVLCSFSLFLLPAMTIRQIVIFRLKGRGKEQFANYSYSFTESMQTSVAHVLRQKSHHFDTLFCISLSSLKSAVPKMYPTPDVVTRVRGNISFPLPFLFFQPHSP